MGARRAMKPIGPSVPLTRPSLVPPSAEQSPLPDRGSSLKQIKSDTRHATLTRHSGGSLFKTVQVSHSVTGTARPSDTHRHTKEQQYFRCTLVRHSSSIFKEIHNMAHLIYPTESLRTAPQTPPPPHTLSAPGPPDSDTLERIDASNASSRCKAL